MAPLGGFQKRRCQHAGQPAGVGHPVRHANQSGSQTAPKPTATATGRIVENNRFHELIGEMAGSAFLKPTLNRLLIDHARIGHTFFRPSTEDMAVNLAKSCDHHDKMITALAERNETAMVNLILEHWDLSRQNMELFIAPRGLKSETTTRAFAREPEEIVGSSSD